MSDQLNVDPISGFPEWLPAKRLAELRLLDLVREQYELFGYAPIETPAVERWDVLTSKKAGGIQPQIYAVGNPAELAKGNIELGLHFDLTVPLARYVSQRREELTFPFRRYQIQKVWRGESAQRGRFREFYQCDVDIVGRRSLSIAADAEVASVLYAALTALGLPPFVLRMSNRKVLSALLVAHDIDADGADAALREIDRFGASDNEKLCAALESAGISSAAIDSIITLITAASLSDAREALAACNASTEGLDELSTVMEQAIGMGVDEASITSDLAIARGLDYYTGTVFETFVTGKEGWGSICSGGRYDHLAEVFTDEPFPGVGTSIGLSRLYDLLESEGLIEAKRQTPAFAMVTMQDPENYEARYLEIARSLRAAGVPTEVFLERASLRDQLGHAVKKGIPYGIIAGGWEFEAGEVAVREFATKSQEKMPLDELPTFLRAKMDADA